MAKFSITIACCLLALVNVCLVYSADVDEMKEKMIGITKACKAEIGASDSDIDDLMNKKPAAGKEGKCLRACMMKKLGMMDANGKFVKAAAVEFAKTASKGNADKLQQMMALIDECEAAVQATDGCEAAEQYKKCFWEKTKSFNMDW